MRVFFTFLKTKSELVFFDKDLEKKRVQTCFLKNPQGVTSAYKGDCSEPQTNPYGEWSIVCLCLYHSVVL
jgi:hypothetical protein